MAQGLQTEKMRLLDNSTKAAPLLVKLHDRHKMYQLAQDPKPEARTELASIMSDLLMVDLSPAEHELITDVLMALINQAEVHLRRAVAERLSVMENVPLRMIVHLANDEIEVADPVLRRSRVLHDMDLMYIVESKGPEYWRSIAMRPCISDQLINSLVETKDVRTAINLTENKNITLTEKAIKSFVEMARFSAALSKPLVEREELSEELIVKLYQFVGAEIKNYIRANFDLDLKEVVDETTNNIINDFRTSMRGEFIPTKQMIAVAEALMSAKRLTSDILVDNLRRGQTASFIAMLSVYAGLPITVVIEMLQQKNGQALAVACKAKRISKSDFVTIFLLTARVRSGAVVNQGVLNKALSYYDAIKTTDAEAILNQSRH